MKTFNQFVNERKKYTETDFTKPGQDGDIYFSKREGNAIAIRQGDKLEMLSTFQGKASLAKVIGSDKRWENMGPASERLLIDLSMKNLGGLATRETQTERGKLLFKFVSSLESVNEQLMDDMYDLAKKSKDLNSFKKAWYKTYSKGPRDMDDETDEWIEVIYNRANGANEESVNEGKFNYTKDSNSVRDLFKKITGKSGHDVLDSTTFQEKGRDGWMLNTDDTPISDNLRAKFVDAVMKLGKKKGWEIKQYGDDAIEIYESVNEAVPSQEDYHTKDKKDVLFTIPGPHAKALATSRAIYKDIEKHGMVFDEFFYNDKGNETGEHLISFPASVNDVSPVGIKKIIKLVGNRGMHIERPSWVNEAKDFKKGNKVSYKDDKGKTKSGYIIKKMTKTFRGKKSIQYLIGKTKTTDSKLGRFDTISTAAGKTPKNMWLREDHIPGPPYEYDNISEPYSIKVGDFVKNTNPSCPHHGSQGIVNKLITMPDDVGTLIKYTVTNSGDTFKPGQALTKTSDQLEPIED